MASLCVRVCVCACVAHQVWCMCLTIQVPYEVCVRVYGNVCVRVYGSCVCVYGSYLRVYASLCVRVCVCACIARTRSGVIASLSRSQVQGCEQDGSSLMSCSEAR